MSNNNFSIAGTYDGTNYNISIFTFGPNDTNLTQYINNNVASPQIINDVNKKQKLLELFKSTKPADDEAKKGVVNANDNGEIESKEPEEYEESSVVEIKSEEFLKFEPIFQENGNNEALYESIKDISGTGENLKKFLKNDEKWEIVEVKADGNCFFYAFIKAIETLDILQGKTITANSIRTYLSRLTEEDINKYFNNDLSFFVGDNQDVKPTDMQYDNFEGFKDQLITENRKKYVDGNVINLIGKIFGILFIIIDTSVTHYYGEYPAKYYIFLNRINNNHYNLLQYDGKRIFTNDSNVITEKLKADAQKIFSPTGGRPQIKKKTRKNRNKRRKTKKRKN